MGRIIRTGTRSVRNRAAINAARWGLRKFGGGLGMRGAGMLGAAGWALPLGLAVFDSWRGRRDRRRAEPEIVAA